jgi:SAM-dependent methyltransferase
MPPVAMPEAPWYSRTFGRAWLAAYAHRGDDEAEANAPHLISLLGLRPGHRVLDICCGAGRYCRSLARRGMRMTGVDLSEDLLQEARERSPLLPGSPLYVRWDARDLPYRGQFDAAISMFTSIGYFQDPADDLRILQGARRALASGGRFLLDFLNAPAVRARGEVSTDRVSGHFRILEDRRIEDGGPGKAWVLKEVKVLNAGTGREESRFEERVRLHSSEEIDDLLESAGFRLRGERLGALDGSPWTPASPRLVRVAERPASGR